MEPCQVGDILFVQSPGVCVDGHAKSCLVDEKVCGMTGCKMRCKQLCGVLEMLQVNGLAQWSTRIRETYQVTTGPPCVSCRQGWCSTGHAGSLGATVEGLVAPRHGVRCTSQFHNGASVHGG